MNKLEAKAALEEHHRLTHTNFVKGEWVELSIMRGYYVFENGGQCPKGEFWDYRKDESFNDGWSKLIIEQKASVRNLYKDEGLKPSSTWSREQKKRFKRRTKGTTL
jgi:hypothetical protein